MECLPIINTSEEYCTGVMSSMQSSCACLLSHGCWWTPGSIFFLLQTNDNHRQSDLNHYFVMIFSQKTRTILNSVMIMIKTEVVCWLCHHELITSINLFVTELVALCKRDVTLPFLCFAIILVNYGQFPEMVSGIIRL